MTPETLQAIGWIAAAIVTVLGGGLGVHRWRNPRQPDTGPQLPPQRQPQPSSPQLQGYPMAPPPPGLVDPLEATGEHDMTWMRDSQRHLQAPPMSAGEWRAFAANAEKMANQSPATQGALEAGLGAVNERLDLVSESVASVRQTVQGLPCVKKPDDGCDVIEVPVTMPPRHPAAPNLRRVKP